MIISYRRISESIEFCELIYIIPYCSIVGMKNMGTIFMHMNSFHLFCIYIPGNMRPFVYHKNGFPSFYCFTGKYSSKKSCSNNQIIVFHGLYPFYVQHYSYYYFLYPSGFLACQFHVSWHMSFKVLLACQPSTCCAFLESAQNFGRSPALRGPISYFTLTPVAFSNA